MSDLSADAPSLTRRFARQHSYSDVEEEELEEKPKASSPITLQKVLTRTIAACVLICFYMLVLRAGHLYCVICVVLTQIELFRELVNVRYVEAREKKMPLFRTIQWSWFFVAMLYVYGESLRAFWEEREQMPLLTARLRYLNYLVFTLYCIVFMTTVLTLKRGLIRFQISQMFWTIVTIGLVVLQCRHFATNTFNGLFWYWFPMATVVMNDVSAYFCGISMGRRFIKTPFLTLSPNKTWEGFIGAAVLTLIFSFYFPAWISEDTWLTCPAEGLYLRPFPAPLHCELNAIFVPRLYTVPNYFHFGPVPAFFQATLKPIQLHGLAYGLFASVVSPFGGFFASAIKRAYGLKDFDAFIPGHGGLMDRMDCQLLMITFSSIHYYTFVEPRPLSVDQMLLLAARMSPEDIIKLHGEIGSKFLGL